MSPEQMNAWRVIPRIAVAVFLALLIYCSLWFMDLKEPTNSQSGFIGAVWLAATGFFNFYMNSGSKNS